MNAEDKSLMRTGQRMLGYLCLLLPVLSVGLGLIGHWRGVNEIGWYQSISATYYANSRIMMIGLLFVMSLCLWAYRGHDRLDNIISSISATAIMLVLMFPCADGGATSEELVGLFCLPLQISGIIHVASASVFYGTSMWLTLRFAKRGLSATVREKRRNKVYYSCLAMMVVGVLFIISTNVVPSLVDKHYFIFIGECFLQAAYGIAWLVKAECFPFLND